MFALSPTTRIYLAAGATDLRKSFEGLSDLVTQGFPQDPLSGHLFLFVNRCQRSVVRVGDDGKVPVGAQRQSIDAPPRTTVIRCLRPDGDFYYLRHAPNPKAKPLVLLHCPVF